MAESDKVVFGGSRSFSILPITEKAILTITDDVRTFYLSFVYNWKNGFTVSTAFWAKTFPDNDERNIRTEESIKYQQHTKWRGMCYSGVQSDIEHNLMI